MVHFGSIHVCKDLQDRAYTVKTSVLFETSVLNMWRVILNYACYFDDHACLFYSCRVEYMEKKEKTSTSAGFELGIAVFVAHCATHSATRYTQGSAVYFVVLLLFFVIEWLKMHSIQLQRQLFVPSRHDLPVFHN